ncbi:MAG: hypothetical protein GY810_17370 [Aureispira sp.]|nr:hypothetical protein [Aureispira sp.]
MASNVTQLSIVEIEECIIDNGGCGSLCLIRNGVVDDSYNFEYKNKQVLAKFRFMALQNKPYKLRYNVKKNKILKLE